MDKKPLILLVDDSPSNLDILSHLLSNDYGIQIAKDGKKAIELASESPQPDLILLDIMMPVVNGYEVCEKLKADKNTAAIPVIFVSAQSEVEDEKKGLELGAVDYITKPFDPNLVKLRVQRHIIMHREHRSLLRENVELKRGIKGFLEIDVLWLQQKLSDENEEDLASRLFLRWDPEKKAADESSENECLKTVTGFLNSTGGIMVIGVDQNRVVKGLQKNDLESIDDLLTYWSELLVSSLGAEFKERTRSTIEHVGELQLLVVQCLPSDQPCFFHRGNEESFCIRSKGETKELRPSEAINYVEQHFVSRRLAVEQTENSDDTSISAWFKEIQQRRLIKTIVIYVVVAWSFTEISTTVAEALHAPEWIVQALVLAFVGGFPIMILLSWIYDLQVTRSQEDSVYTKNGWFIAFSFGLTAVMTYALYSLLVTGS